MLVSIYNIVTGVGYQIFNSDVMACWFGWNHPIFHQVNVLWNQIDKIHKHPATAPTTKEISLPQPTDTTLSWCLYLFFPMSEPITSKCVVTNITRLLKHEDKRVTPKVIHPIYFHGNYRGCSRGVMLKAMDCRTVVSEFVLQSRYYVHFWANTLGKGMNPLILPTMG